MFLLMLKLHNAHLPIIRVSPNLLLPTQNIIIPINPRIKHIPKAHITCKMHGPPLYTTEAPTFSTITVIKVLYEVN